MSILRHQKRSEVSYRHVKWPETPCVHFIVLKSQLADSAKVFDTVTSPVFRAKKKPLNTEESDSSETSVTTHGH